MKRLILLAVAGLPFFAAAQPGTASGYAGLITQEALRQHLTIIAGAAMEGRETGKEGQRKAAAYIEAQYKAMGLLSAPSLNGYQQYYPLYKDSLVLTKLNIGGNEMAFGKDYAASLNNNNNGKAYAKKIVFAGYGINDKKYNDYAGKNVKGKVVVFVLGEPKKDGIYLINGTKKPSEWTFPGLSRKLQEAYQQGAAAAIVISPVMSAFTERMMMINRKSNFYYPRSNGPTINAVNFSHAAAANLLGAAVFDTLLKKAKNSEPLNTADIKEMKAKFSFVYQKSREQVNASNVIGIVEGTDKKDEYVFLTAHYDHLGMQDGKIFYGADDDGSGTVAVIQMAAAFARAKAAGHGPRRTVVFMTVSGEEKGLWGSEYYSNNPVFPLDKTTVDLNTDMVGRIDPNRKTGDSMNYVYVIGHDKLSSDLPVINEGVNNQYVKMELDYKYDDPKDPDRIYYRSDHYNFARKGVPILFFFDGIHKDYHKTTDTIDKINWDLYARRVQLIFYTAWDMANRDELLKRDIPLPE